MAPETEKKPKTICFTIDGRRHTIEDKKHQASELLRLAGLDPAGYDLAEVRHGDEPRRFADDEVVKVDEGDAFITIRHSGPVA